MYEVEKWRAEYFEKKYWYLFGLLTNHIYSDEDKETLRQKFNLYIYEPSSVMEVTNEQRTND